MDQVFYYFEHLLKTEGFPPRWFCGSWNQFTGWFYIFSDLAIWAAYMSIPCILIFFVFRLKNAPFPRIFLLFAAFIFACGSTHLLDALMFWWPAYRLSGLVYFLTALISWITVIALIPIVPKALSLKTPAYLENMIGIRTRELEERTTALLDSESRMRAILETTVDAIITIDDRANILSFNQAAIHLFGYTPDEVIGSNVNVLMPNPYHNEHDHYLANYQHTGIPKIIGIGREVTARHKNGSIFPIDLSVSEVHLKDQKIFTGIIRDITEQKKTQDALHQLTKELEQRVHERTAQLETANKELEAFSYSVSHDLRAPLRGIDGFSEVLLQEYSEILDDRGRHYLDRIRQGSQQMGQLIDDMLQLSRITREEMHVQSIDLSAIARQIVQDLKEQNPERLVECLIADPVSARGDSLLLHTVLQNLLDNAWKYTSKKSSARIEFGLSKQDGQSTYFVRDNGAGFDMKYVGKLFGAFQRLHAASDFAGTGVGLATVARIIHRHGGKVWAEGVLGEGATFYFTLGQIKPDSF
jgi:PAS domain S-box-containing protein